VSRRLLTINRNLLLHDPRIARSMIFDEDISDLTCTFILLRGTLTNDTSRSPRATAAINLAKCPALAHDSEKTTKPSVMYRLECALSALRSRSENYISYSLDSSQSMVKL